MITKAKEMYKDSIQYLKGEHTENNIKLSFEKCKVAADMEYMPAINLLGVFYATGCGTTKNINSARVCFKKCERESIDAAIYNIGILDIAENGLRGEWHAACYFEDNLNKIQNGKLVKLMSDMIKQLDGELEANASNIVYLMRLMDMKERFCILDTDGNMLWTDLKGYINEAANSFFNNL